MDCEFVLLSEDVCVDRDHWRSPYASILPHVDCLSMVEYALISSMFVSFPRIFAGVEVLTDKFLDHVLSLWSEATFQTVDC